MSAARFYAFCLASGASTLAGAQSLPWFISPGTTRVIVARAGVSRLNPKAINQSQANPSPSAPAEPPTATVTPPPVPPPQKTKEDKPPRRTSWLERTVLDRIQVTGSRTLGFHSHQVEGDTAAFDLLNYYGQGDRSFTDTGSMNVSGKNVLGFLNFDLSYASTDYTDPNAQRVTLTYAHGPWNISAGDIAGRLINSNPYAALARTLRGASAEYKLGRFNVKALRTEARGATRTVNLQGANSLGPYYLESGRVVADSVQVQVDGQDMRMMDDYVVDADVGSITFVNRIIPPTSNIVVTYEAYGLSTSGVVQGAGFTYDMGKFGRVGLTGVEQKSGSSGLGSSEMQQFQGYGDASYIYTLYYEPIPGSAVVKVDGILQVEGVDYYFLPDAPFMFRFNRAIPDTQTITVVYRPKSVQNLDGDRKVWGFDYRLPFGRDGRNGYLQYSQATGSLISDSNPMSGTARGIEGQYKFGEFTLRGATHRIPSDFVSIQSLGFQRNEDATDLGLDWTHKRWTISAKNQNSVIANRMWDDQNQTATYVNTRYTKTSLSATYTASQNDSLSLQQSQQKSYYGGDRQLDTTAVSGLHSFGKRLQSDYSVQYQSGFFPATDENGAVHRESISLQTTGFGLRYSLPSGFSLNGRASLSKVTALGDTSNGYDYSLGGTYNPDRGRLKASANYTLSNGGQAAAIGNFGGYGYGGNGFSGGLPGDGTYFSADTSLRSLGASAQYQASDRINIDAHAASTEVSGSLSSNSRTLAYGLGLDWDLGNYNQLGLNIDQTNTAFLDVAYPSSNSTSLDFYFSGAPKGPWSYRLNFSRFLSGNGSPYSTSTLSFDGMLGYKLTRQQRLYLQYIMGRSTGYYGQTENSLYFSYERQLFGNVSVIGSYKIRDVRNLSTEDSSGSYKSKGFDLELSFNFR